MVVMRADQKLYPPVMRLAAEIAQLRATEHDLHCRQQLSIRATQRALLDQGVRRSLGMLHRDLTGWRCPYCTPQPPEPPVKPRSFQWR